MRCCRFVLVLAFSASFHFSRCSFISLGSSSGFFFFPGPFPPIFYQFECLLRDRSGAQKFVSAAIDALPSLRGNFEKSYLEWEKRAALNQERFTLAIDQNYQHQQKFVVLVRCVEENQLNWTDELAELNKNGQDYEPDSLRIMIAALDRQYPLSIVKDREFHSSKQVLEEKRNYCDRPVVANIWRKKKEDVKLVQFTEGQTKADKETRTQSSAIITQECLQLVAKDAQWLFLSSLRVADLNTKRRLVHFTSP